MHFRWTLAACVTGLFLANTNAPSAAEDLRFSLPVDCIIGETCFLQSLVDIDTGTDRLDPFCGAASYDGHKGTDIRVRDYTEMRAGMPVLAMADGYVMGSRNTAPERLIETDADRDAVKGKECGNGVLINHGGGWTAQLCHLAKGSVRVRKGDRVKRGQQIGIIGLSGRTAFPHVHVTLRKDNKVIDPMIGLHPGDACGQAGETLWTEEAARELGTETTALLQTGYADGPVTSTGVMKNEFNEPSLKGPLVFFATFINVRKGDIIEVEISGPEGIIAKSASKPLSRHRAVHTIYGGKRGALTAGSTYSSSTRLLRNGEVIAEETGVEIGF